MATHVNDRSFTFDAMRRLSTCGLLMQSGECHCPLRECGAASGGRVGAERQTPLDDVTTRRRTRSGRAPISRAMGSRPGLPTMPSYPLGRDRADRGISVLNKHDNVARNEHSELRFGGERLMSERRVARAEDGIRLALDAELGAQRRLHVDLTQDPEALGSESHPCTRERIREVGPGTHALHVARWLSH